MNKRDWIILSILVNFGYGGQKDIVQRTGYSIGLVSSSLKKLIDEGYLDVDFNITGKTTKHLEASKPRRAIILAAGIGLRMIPITKMPKGLLKISGEPLIERTIKQLNEAGITDITIVTGFMAEKFDYLIDKFGVRLIYDHEYTRRDSLNSLSLAADSLSNCYVVPCNVWFARNPFQKNEFFSWYAVSEYIDDESYVRLNRKLELVYTEDESGGNSMIGLCYLSGAEAAKTGKRIKTMSGQRKHQKEPWEKALLSGNKMIVYARVLLGQSNYKIDTYEQLRELDSDSNDLRSRRMDLISGVFNTPPENITDISRLFKGMTNRLMRFSIYGKPYLLRVPGEGSNELTNRRQEAAVYDALAGKGITDKVVYISPEDGYKIAEYWEGSRVCDPGDDSDVYACMKHLRKLHGMKLEISHTFDIMEKIELYENLRDSESSFEDYAEIRQKITYLLLTLACMPKESTLCHIDPVFDNFLFVNGDVYLVDWEYAGMCEAHIDIAMFCLYADYEKEKVDRVIDIYYDGRAENADRFKVYAYAAAAGLLWTVWCEYKEKMGVNYGDYAMRQYRYAKRFYRYATRLAEAMAIESKVYKI